MEKIIMKKLLNFKIIVLAVLFISISTSAQTNKSTSIFSVDFVKAKEGQYENYLENLEKNWVAARKTAKTKKYIKSFQLLVLPKDDKNDWNFILITEYADQKQFDDREKHFDEIFKKSPPIAIKGLKSSDMREIILSKEFTTPIWAITK
jgi:hypothetical protein